MSAETLPKTSSMLPHIVKAVTFPAPTSCAKCGSYIWGVSGYRCDNCLMPIHKKCYKTLTGQEIKCSGIKGTFQNFWEQSLESPTPSSANLQGPDRKESGIVGERKLINESKKGFNTPSTTKLTNPNDSRKATFDLDSIALPSENQHQKSLTLIMKRVFLTIEGKPRSGTGRDFNNDKPLMYVEISNASASQRAEAVWDCEVNSVEYYKFDETHPGILSFLYRDQTIFSIKLNFEVFERKASHSKTVSVGHTTVEMEIDSWNNEHIVIEFKKDKKTTCTIEFKGSILSLTLQKMIHDGDLAAVKLLSAQGNCWINGTDTAGWTLLHTACANFKDDAKILKSLLEYKGIDPNLKNNLGQSACFFLGNNITEDFKDPDTICDIMKRFHALGVDFMQKNERKETILHNCLIRRTKNPFFLEGLLMAAKECLGPEKMKEFVNTPSGFKNRAVIHYAARLNPIYFRILQKYGADISLRDADEMNALELAEINGTKEMKTFLQSKGYKITRDLEEIVGLQDKTWVIDASDLDFHTSIASGTSGDVWRGTYLGQTAAIKVLKGNNSNENYSRSEAEEFKKEAELNAMIRSPYIVKFYGVCLQPLYLVMEFCENGSLFNLMSNKPSFFGWTEFFRFAIEMSKAINCLHSAEPQIVHRDLKSLNIMVNERFTLKLGDFGLSRTVTEENSKTFRQQRGTSSWKAPEIIQGAAQGTWCDVYSLAIIFWEMANTVVLGKYVEPFQEYNFRNSFALEAAISKKQARPTIPRLCPPPLRSLIEKGWHPEAKQRPTCVQLIGTIYQVEEIYENNCGMWDSLDFGGTSIRSKSDPEPATVSQVEPVKPPATSDNNNNNNNLNNSMKNPMNTNNSHLKPTSASANVPPFKSSVAPKVSSPNTTMPSPNATMPSPNATMPSPNATMPSPNATMPSPNAKPQLPQTVPTQVYANFPPLSSSQERKQDFDEDMEF